MAKLQADQPLIPSVLDRLLDDDPSTLSETPKSRTQVLRELKQSVRRDLENLLNTRIRFGLCPPDLVELEVSLASYGIPDLGGIDLGAAHDREGFRRALERVIGRFEPRFKRVRVEMLATAEPRDRTLRFRIDAMLYAEPAPEPVVFDSSLQPATGNVEVKGTAL
jgi:type VI secretion system protein ImpF